MNPISLPIRPLDFEIAVSRNRRSDVSDIMQQVTFPRSLNDKLNNCGQNSHLAPSTTSLSQSDHLILKLRDLVNGRSDSSDPLQRVTLP